MKKHFALSIAFMAIFSAYFNFAEAAANNKLQISSIGQDKTKDGLSNVSGYDAISSSLKNNYEQDLIIKKIKVKADTNLDVTSEIKNFDLVLFSNGIQEGPINPTSNGEAVFNNINFPIPAGDDHTFQVSISTGGSNFSGQIRFGITEVIAKKQGSNSNVYAYHRNTKLGDSIDETLLLRDADCEISRDVTNKSAPKYICGPLFNIHTAPFLRVSKINTQGRTIFPNSETEVIRMKLKATVGSVLVKRLFFSNVIPNGVTSGILDGIWTIKDREGNLIEGVDVSINGLNNIEFKIPDFKWFLSPNQTEEFLITFKPNNNAKHGSAIKLELDLNNTLNNPNNHFGLETAGFNTPDIIDPVKNAEFFDLAIPAGYGNVKGNIFRISNRR